MEASKLKNMVILRNLPSNIVEEAIVILKNGKKIEKIQQIEKNRGTEEKKKQIKKEKDYILKEAEMLINNYISDIEKSNELERKKQEINKKNKKFKRYMYISIGIMLIQSILLIIQL